VKEDILLHEQRAMQIARAGSAAKDGAPDAVLAYLFDQLIEGICHG
jgi:hypothetical protein